MLELAAVRFVTRKEVANNDDVSDVDDVDLEYRWRSTYSSADRSHREAAEKVIICAAKTGQ